ncbi:sigma-70 RNA polymerase sigma factor region 4 domain-containing protein [Lapidilactobacillus wuchangensis]|jgi:hypothetical protein|uniref:sigma-70 family RNA polymerase sigma factor n=1 Tax=Lapidilactobacillus wuchangensis TaxID=2486001 RepID=UPI000F7A48C7|nr:sigma-70 family RNA polymerase sigma factor [Lapidilactobacillus wuchangensis]
MKYSVKRFSWLESYLENEEEIASLQISLNRSRIELTRWVEGDLAKVRLEKGSRASRLEEIISENERLLREDISLREQTLDLINHFDGIENEILKRKYVKGMSLIEIADCDDIGYSYSTVKKIHAELKRTLRFLDKWDLPEKSSKKE